MQPTVEQSKLALAAVTVHRSEVDGNLYHTIFTWGYGGQSISNLAEYASVTGAVILDVRYSPRSWDPTWRSDTLKARFGADYLTARGLGNINYNNDGPMQLYDPEMELPRLKQILLRRSVIMMCACKQWKYCHRDMAARYVSAQLGARLWHLPQSYAHFVDKQLPSLYDEAEGTYRFPLFERS